MPTEFRNYFIKGRKGEIRHEKTDENLYYNRSGVLGIFLVIGSIAGGATWATLKTAVPFLEDREFDLLEEIEDKGGDARYREEAGAYSEKEYEDIREIQVELSDDRIEFLIYDGPDVRVEVQDDVQSRVAHYLDGSHELVIESHGKGNPYSTVLVYLPENLSLEELEIRLLQEWQAVRWSAVWEIMIILYLPGKKTFRQMRFRWKSEPEPIRENLSGPKSPNGR